MPPSGNLSQTGQRLGRNLATYCSHQAGQLGWSQVWILSRNQARPVSPSQAPHIRWEGPSKACISQVFRWITGRGVEFHSGLSLAEVTSDLADAFCIHQAQASNTQEYGSRFLREGTTWGCMRVALSCPCTPAYLLQLVKSWLTLKTECRGHLWSLYLIPRPLPEYLIAPLLYLLEQLAVWCIF